jgi:hypothetical protein
VLATWGTSTGRNPTLDLQFAGATSLDNRITFSRGSQATLFDSAGTLVYAKHNLLQRSQALATLPWFNSGLTSIANDTTDVTDPAGGNNASKLVVAGAAGIVGQDAGTLIANQTYVGSVWLRCASGTVSGSLIVYLGIAPFTNIGTQSITITTTWQRFTVTTSAATAAAYNFQIHNLNGGTVYAYGAQFNLVGMEGGVTSSLATYYPTTTAAYYAPRFDYNPSTLAALGLLIEEQRTNSIRNNTMQGAVAGTPGTLPTNWSVSGLGTLTREIVGTGTSNGVTYVDIRFSGTTSTTQLSIRFEPSNVIAAANGQTWAFSSWVARVGGSTSNITEISANANLYDSGSVFLAGLLFTGYPGTVGTTLTRVSGAGTIATASTAFIQPQIYLNFASGVAIDITLRVGLPQLELGAFATSVIPTTTTALTRNADVASMTGTNFSSWYNQTEGTFVCNFVDPQSGISGAFFPGIFSASDNSTSNRITCYRDAAVDYKTVVTTSGVLQSNLTNAAVSTSQRRIASAYKLNDFAACGQGGSVATDTSGTVPTVDRFYVGSNQTGGSQLCGYIQRISYYPVRLPNSTLQALTA